MQKASLLRLVLAPLALSAIMAAPAQASLISVNTAFGTGSATLDTATNLQWLDLTITKNMSEATVSGLLGTTYAPYRYATAAEVETLFGDAGLAITGSNPLAPLNGSDPVANYPPAVSFLNLFGVLNTNSLRRVSIGITGTQPFTDFWTTYSVEARTNAGHVTYGLVYSGFSGTKSANTTTGSFLVTSVETPTATAVPEPASLLLLATGLGAAFRRRQR